MQSFPPSLRILQSVHDLTGADDSLQAINTNEVSPGSIVVVQRSNSDSGLDVPALYILRKDSTTANNPPAVVAPAQGGPGRWFPYALLAAQVGAPAAVAVFHAAIPPQTSVDATVAIAGVVDSSDIVLWNLADNTVPAGVILGQPRVTAPNSVNFRFLNATAATVVAATVSVEYSILT
jgi:hypothetical protein